MRYKFAFGLGIGAIWDQGKISNTTTTAAAQISIKRTVWAFPLTYDMGNHHIMGTYARARDWRGTIGGVGVGGVLSPAIGGAAPRLGRRSMTPSSVVCSTLIAML